MTRDQWPPGDQVGEGRRSPAPANVESRVATEPPTDGNQPNAVPRQGGPQTRRLPT
jgi:hypothetical protein